MRRKGVLVDNDVMNAKQNHLIIGAGLVGSRYARERLKEPDTKIFGTAYEAFRAAEEPLVVKRIFGENLESIGEEQIGTKTFATYGKNKKYPDFYMTSLNLLNPRNSELDELLNGFAKEGIELNTVVNATNIGTILGLALAEGEPIFKFEDMYSLIKNNINDPLENYAKTMYENNPKYSLQFMSVLTTGSGGMGLNRLNISHDAGKTVKGGPEYTIAMKSQMAATILHWLRDANRTNEIVRNLAVVPAAAIIDLEILSEKVTPYGQYKSMEYVVDGFKKVIADALPFYRAKRIVNDKLEQKLEDTGEPLKALHGWFGEDGPHTLYDSQNLQSCMGLISVTKVANAMINTIDQKGSYNLDVINHGQEMVEQSEHMIGSFEYEIECVRKELEEKYGERAYAVSVAPISFEMATNNIALHLISKSLDSPTTKDLANAEGSKLVTASIKYLLSDEARGFVDTSTSIGLTFDLKDEKNKLKFSGPFERGRFDSTTIEQLIGITSDFNEFYKNSNNFREILIRYEDEDGNLPLEKVIGYVGAFPIASSIRKLGHFE